MTTAHPGDKVALKVSDDYGPANAKAATRTVTLSGNASIPSGCASGTFTPAVSHSVTCNRGLVSRPNDSFVTIVTVPKSTKPGTTLRVQAVAHADKKQAGPRSVAVRVVAKPKPKPTPTVSGSPRPHPTHSHGHAGGSGGGSGSGGGTSSGTSAGRSHSLPNSGSGLPHWNGGTGIGSGTAPRLPSGFGDGQKPGVSSSPAPQLPSVAPPARSAHSQGKRTGDEKVTANEPLSIPAGGLAVLAGLAGGAGLIRVFHRSNGLHLPGRHRSK